MTLNPQGQYRVQGWVVSTIFVVCIGVVLACRDIHHDSGWDEGFFESPSSTGCLFTTRGSNNNTERGAG